MPVYTKNENTKVQVKLLEQLPMQCKPYFTKCYIKQSTSNRHLIVVLDLLQLERSFNYISQLGFSLLLDF